MNFIAKCCFAYTLTKFLRYLDGVKWLAPSGAQCRTVKTVKPLPVVHETLPNVAGISAGDYFYARRRNRVTNPPSNDLSDSTFAEWRAKNNR